MNRLFLRSFVALLFLSAIVLSQTPPAPPAPAPEVKKLEYFVGDWKMEGDMKPGPMGPGGKFTGTETTKWMDGGFFIVSHSDFKSPGMTGKGLSVMGYDADEKKYAYTAFNSFGEHETAKGTLEGDTWTWLNEGKKDGKVMRGRFTIKETSPTAYTFKFEMAPEDGDFATVMEGKATKQ